MANQRSDKSPFESRYGGGWISAGQWLAENMVARFARSEGQQLTNQFWQQPYWKKKFLQQLNLANDLLQSYSVNSIVMALRHPDAKKIYSFGLKSVLVPLIEKAQKKEMVQILNVPELIHVDVMEKPRLPFSTNRHNTLKKLKLLADEE